MTKVRVDFFKYTGKWYDSFEFESSYGAHEITQIVNEAKSKKEFINEMSFTIEVDEKNKGWNMYLYPYLYKE